MAERCFLAVDLGASGGRVTAGLFDGRKLRLEEAARFPNGPTPVLGSLHWDVLGIWNQLRGGLRKAASQWNDVVSVGVDAWGVDYGLLGRGDVLLGNPNHYRDPRTKGIIDQVTEIVSREEIFESTGLQFMEFNTLFQLYAMRRDNSPLLDAAEQMLMIPDLFHWLLTGAKAVERT
ncbi:MAG: FGGY family carbohydrate kinase, partial [Planctomycetales bacterium]